MISDEFKSRLKTEEESNWSKRKHAHIKLESKLNSKLISVIFFEAMNLAADHPDTHLDME